MKLNVLIVACAGSALVGVIAGIGIGKTAVDGGGEVASPPVVKGSGLGAVPVVVASEESEVDLARRGISDRELRALGTKWGAEDPIAAVARADELPTTDRYLYLEAVYSAWAERDGPGAAAWVGENLQGTEKSDALSYIADGWGESDPAAAADWFNENTGGEMREDAMLEILESWGRKHPEEALSWTEQLDPYVRSWVMEGLADGWGGVDPAAAAAAGLAMQDTDYGVDFLVAVTTQWAGRSPQDAAQWAAGLESDKLRSAVFVEIGNEWALTDPAAALAWAQGVEDPKLRKTAERGIASGWAEHDPGGAMGWAMAGIEDPRKSQRLVERIMMEWAEMDPSGAGQWIVERPEGDSTDMMLGAYSEAVAEIDPEAAVTWAATISDVGKRNKQLRTLLSDWIELDGKTAREQIGEMELPDEVINSILQPSGR